MCVTERFCICLVYNLHYINTVYFCVRYGSDVNIRWFRARNRIDYKLQSSKNNLSLHDILYTFY